CAHPTQPHVPGRPVRREHHHDHEGRRMTSSPNPQARLGTVVVEADPEFADETPPTGLTTAGHIELRDAIGQGGTVAHISRTARAVPTPPVVPVKSQRTRAFARRREALERAVALAQTRGVASAEMALV